MARRRCTGHGAMAATIARLYERRAARVVGAWLPPVECVLLAALRQLGLARHAMDRHPPSVGDRLHPLLRQGAGGVGREPTPPKGGEPQRQGTARGDLPPRYRWQHAERLLVSVRWLCHLLLNQCAVRD